MAADTGAPEEPCSPVCSRDGVCWALLRAVHVPPGHHVAKQRFAVNRCQGQRLSSGAHCVVASHPLRMRKARGSNPTGRCHSDVLRAWATNGKSSHTQRTFLAAGSDHGAHGVVVSHPLRMRKALGSNPSVSISAAVPQLRLWQLVTCMGNEQEVCTYADQYLAASSKHRCT